MEEAADTATGSASNAWNSGVGKSSFGESFSSEGSVGKEDTGGKASSSVSLPFPFILSANDIKVKMIDGSFTQLHNLDIYLNPNQKSNSNDLAICLDAFDSKLLQFAIFILCGQLPLNMPNEIQSLAVTARIFSHLQQQSNRTNPNERVLLLIVVLSI